MKDIIKEAIEQAHKDKPGIILPAADIYNAILRAGRKQVVEWIDEHSENMYSNDTRGSYVEAHSKKEWQAQKKEWKC